MLKSINKLLIGIILFILLSSGLYATDHLLVILPGEIHDTGSPTGKSGSPIAQQAGVTISVQVLAVDSAFNIDTSDNNNITITCGDPYAEFTSAQTLSSGSVVFTLTMKRSLSIPEHVNAIYDAGGVSYGMSECLVEPGPFYGIQLRVYGESADAGSGTVTAFGWETGVSGSPVFQVVGMPFYISVTASDIYGNRVFGVTDTIRLYSTDPYALAYPGASNPIDIVLIDGQAEVTGTLYTASIQQLITYSDLTDPTKNVMMAPSAATYVEVIMPDNLEFDVSVNNEALYSGFIADWSKVISGIEPDPYQFLLKVKMVEISSRQQVALSQPFIVTAVTDGVASNVSVPGVFVPNSGTVEGEYSGYMSFSESGRFRIRVVEPGGTTVYPHAGWSAIIDIPLPTPSITPTITATLTESPYISATATPTVINTATITMTTTPLGIEGLWHEVPDSESAPNRGYSSSTSMCWYYGIDGQLNYDTGGVNSGEVILGPYLIGTNQGVSFWSWEETEGFASPGTVDARKVYISDDGSNWTKIKDLAGAEIQWYKTVINLSAYDGQNVLIKFVFDTVDGFNNDYRGWYVDDVLIETIASDMSIAEAVDNYDLVFTTGGDASWFGQTEYAYHDGDAARSGAIGDNQSSYFETTVTGPGVVSFNWMVSSEKDFDYLYFTINGQMPQVPPEGFYGYYYWMYEGYVMSGTNTYFGLDKVLALVPEGEAVLRWEFKKDNSNSDGLDAAFVDRIVFVNITPTITPTIGNSATSTLSRTPTQMQSPTVTVTSTITPSPTLTHTPGSISIGEAVDNMGLVWTFGGDSAWIGQNSTFINDNDAAQSGSLTDNGYNYISTTIPGNSMVRFYWKVSSEELYDNFGFMADNDVLENISGEVDWEQKSFSFGAGSHVITWIYSKDENISGGMDAAWVDMIEIISITPSSTPTITQSNTPSPFHTPTITMTLQNTPTAINTPLITSIEEGADNFSLSFITGGDGIWYGQNEKYLFDGDSVKPSELAYGESSYFETTVTGPGVLSFYIKYTVNSYIDFKIDGMNKTTGSNYGPWRKIEHYVDSGVHSFRWEISEYSIPDTGGEDVYIDQIVFVQGTQTVTPTITAAITNTVTVTSTMTNTVVGSYTETPTITATSTQTISINEGVDNYGIAFSDSGHKAWYAVYDPEAVDGDCVKSGDLDPGEESQLIMELEGPAMLYFKLKLSSEINGDNFRLIVQNGGTSTSMPSGPNNQWLDRSEYLEPGNNIIRFEYKKDYTITVGEDSVWVDDIVYVHVVDTATPYDTWEYHTQTPTGSYTYTPTETETPILTPIINTVPESTWYIASQYAGFGGRYGHDAVVFKDKMWLIGGYNGYEILSDVWNSIDGREWNRVSEGVISSRAFNTVEVFLDKLWVIGGIDNFGNISNIDTIKVSADGINWKTSTSNTGFSNRYGHASVIFDNKMWVIGGRGEYVNDTDNGNLADVWYSHDGIHWFLVRDDAPFGKRALHAAETFNNGIVVIGGQGADYGYMNDIWYSQDGYNWIELLSQAPFVPRTGASVAVHDGKLWYIAGQNSNNGNSEFLKDVWFTEDGMNWSFAGDGNFEEKAYAKAISYKGSLWLLGGIKGYYAQLFDTKIWHAPYFEYHTPTVTATLTQSPVVTVTPTLTVTATSTESPFVTSTPTSTITITSTPSATAETLDTWQLATSSASFEARAAHSAVVFNDYMWIIGGYGNVSGSLNDVWRSSDGVTWELVTASAAFPAGYFSDVVVFNNEMWIAGGTGIDDAVYSSSDGVNWTLRAFTIGMISPVGIEILNYNGYLWIIEENGTVWYSSNGITWSQATTTGAYSANGEQFEACVFNNAMWIAGGDNETGSVWSSTDGVTWTEMTSAAASLPRVSSDMMVFNSKMYLVAGFEGINDSADVWSSIDGITWIQETPNAGFAERVDGKNLIYKGKMWMIGGYSYTLGNFLNDVWYAPPGPLPSATPTESVTFTVTVTPTLTITQTSTQSPVVTSTPTSTITVTSTESPFLTPTPTSTITATSSVTATITSVATPWTQSGLWHEVPDTAAPLNPYFTSTSSVVWYYGQDGVLTYDTGVANSGSIVTSAYSIIAGCTLDFWSWAETENGTSIPPFVYDARRVYISTTGEGGPWTEVLQLGGLESDWELIQIPLDTYAGQNVNFRFEFDTDDDFMNDYRGWYIDDVNVSYPTTPTSTATITETSTTAPTPVLDNWQLATANAAFSPRFGHMSLVYDNKMWVIGGYSLGDVNSEVWFSANGVDWESATLNAEFGGRVGHTGAVFAGKMWLTGGGTNSPLVYSSTDGEVWNVEASVPEFADDNLPKMMVHDNKLWLLQSSGSVFSSSDGASWSNVTTTAAYSALGTDFGVCVYDNKMWAAGGTSFNQSVWSSSDGINWTEETSVSPALPRGLMGMVVFDSRMYIIAGAQSGMSMLRDVWSTEDGINWIAETLNANFGARGIHSSVVFDNRVWVIGGFSDDLPGDANDVWYSPPGPLSTPTATQTSTQTVTQSTTQTATQSVTSTVTPSVTSTVSSTITQTSTFTISVTGTPPTLTITQTITATNTEVNTETTTQTVTQSATPSLSMTITPSVTASVTETNTVQHTMTVTPSITFTVTEFISQTVTGTITPSITQTLLPSETATETITSTVSPSLTYTPSITSTITYSSTPTNTDVIIFTFTVTPTVTQTAAATSTATSGIPEPEEIDGTYTYPQPAKDEINFVFRMKRDGTANIMIYNSAGRYVASVEKQGMAGTNSVHMDTQKFAPGIYYYLINYRSATGDPEKLKVNKFMITGNLK